MLPTEESTLPLLDHPYESQLFPGRWIDAFDGSVTAVLARSIVTLHLGSGTARQCAHMPVHTCALSRGSCDITGKLLPVLVRDLALFQRLKT